MPLKDRSPEQQTAQDPTTGCLGCASGKGAGPRNIFGNKYGQYLAAVQIAREERMAKLQAEREAKAAQDRDDDGEETSDDEDEGDYGPNPVAGIWAGSQRLQNQSNTMIPGQEDDDGDDETDDEDEEGPLLPPTKKIRQE